MPNSSVHLVAKTDRRSKIWSTPCLRSVIPARRTRGGSGAANGDVDGLIYDLS